MRFWFDTEFIEDGHTIDLLSIGLVAEDGREYYAVSSDADWSRASDWVTKNVLPHLLDQCLPFKVTDPKSRRQIRHEILEFVGETPVDAHSGRQKRHEFWAYYGAYDWVVFCQLFGRMIDLPKHFPMYVRDVKQLADELGNPALPLQPKNAHHALVDARWTREAWTMLQGLRERTQA